MIAIWPAKRCVRNTHTHTATHRLACKMASVTHTRRHAGCNVLVYTRASNTRHNNHVACYIVDPTSRSLWKVARPASMCPCARVGRRGGGRMLPPQHFHKRKRMKLTYPSEGSTNTGAHFSCSMAVCAFFAYPVIKALPIPCLECTSMGSLHGFATMGLQRNSKAFSSSHGDHSCLLRKNGPCVRLIAVQLEGKTRSTEETTAGPRMKLCVSKCCDVSQQLRKYMPRFAHLLPSLLGRGSK